MSANAPIASATAAKPITAFVALTGNPNCGKTTLFNELTGLRAKVGNYAGVTVERKEGRLRHTAANVNVTVLDLPGTYSLSPKSLDEQISRDVLFHRLGDVPAPAAVMVVVDASNLERNLYYATQVIELGYPTVVALNMVDVARENGHEIDAAKLSKALGVAVIPTVASTGEGIDELRAALVDLLGASRPEPKAFCELPKSFEPEVERIAAQLETAFHQRHTSARTEALLLLTDEAALAKNTGHYPEAVQALVREARAKLEAAGHDWRSAAIEARYARVSAINTEVVTEAAARQENLSDKLDRVFTHKVWGLLIFVGIMALIFQSIFSFAEIPMNLLEQGVAWIGEHVGRIIPEGDLNSLLVDGVIAGVGAVVVFLPQICLLFLFIGLLEDTGYMARAAFLMDRLMSKVGLHGKSFIPMLSSYACAIPGIMATRTIENPKDRLATILISPLMSCSARLPVYTLLIAACIPERTVLGFLKLSALTMLGMYLLGTVTALFMAWLLKKTLLKGEPPVLIMELPPYKRPVLKVTLRHMWDRSKLFLQRAGTVILGISIILWFLATYPRSSAIQQEYDAKRQALTTATFPGVTEAQAIEDARAEALAAIDKEEAGAKLRHSFAGRLGRLMEPVIAPLGFDWKIGIGLVASFAAREVFVSTMSTVYNVGAADESEEGTQRLAEIVRAQTHEDGRPVYTTLTGLTLMVFYVYALQCVSTVAVVRRETNSWKWPLFQWAYMGLLAWVAAFVVYQGGRLLGW
ncbi:MAG: ferrous iron transport protein B [Verrucomicrobiota bacterium]